MLIQETHPESRFPNQVQRIFQLPWWRDYSIPHETFGTKTCDGVSLQGVHLVRGSDTLLVYCHGFLSGKNFAAVPRFMEMLAERVDVIAFDFRGHGESGGECTIGENELFDLDSMVRYARNFNYRRIFLAGSSMGGAVAIRYAAASPEIAGVVTIGAFATGDFSLLARTALKCFDWNITHSFVRQARRARVASTIPQSAPVNVVHQIAPRPLLLIHGEYDMLVPLRHARELYASAREPKELIVVPHGSHDIRLLTRRTSNRILGWIRNHDATEAEVITKFGIKAQARSGARSGLS